MQKEHALSHYRVEAQSWHVLSRGENVQTKIYAPSLMVLGRGSVFRQN